MCTEGQRAWAILVRGEPGKQREISKHGTTRKERLPDRTGASEARQGGFLGYCDRGPRRLTLAPEAPRIMFTVVGIKSNNDNNIDNKGHSCGSLTLLPPQQHPLRLHPVRVGVIPTQR